METYRVFVVDDDADTCELLAEILEREGFVAQHATSGTQALLAAAARPPDIVLLDLLMPKMSGIEVMKRLRELDSTKDVPVVGQTAGGMPGDREAALAVGAAAVLIKPAPIDELVDVLRHVLARTRTPPPIVE